MCRQSLSEFCGPEFTVICDEGEATAEYRLGDLLPGTISRETLGK
jgi:cytidine deaminase